MLLLSVFPKTEISKLKKPQIYAQIEALREAATNSNHEFYTTSPERLREVDAMPKRHHIRQQYFPKSLAWCKQDLVSCLLKTKNEDYAWAVKVLYQYYSRHESNLNKVIAILRKHGRDSPSQRKKARERISDRSKQLEVIERVERGGNTPTESTNRQLVDSLFKSMSTWKKTIRFIRTIRNDEYVSVCLLNLSGRTRKQR